MGHKTIERNAPTRQRATLADVAAMTGVSKTVVSRVLSGRTGTTRFSPLTEERVRRAAESLHYRPNLAMRLMRERRTMTLGLALPGSEPAYLKFIPSMIETAAEAGYQVIVAMGGPAPERLPGQLSQMLDREVDGLVLVPTVSVLQSQVFRELMSLRIPTVIAEHRLLGSDLDFVGMDDVAGYRQIVAHLKAMGHRKIAMLYESETATLSGHQRLVDFERVLDEAGLPVLPKNYLQGVAEVQIDPKVIDQFDRIFGKNREVTAVVVRGYGRLQWVMARFEEMGIRVPEDLSVVNISARDYAEARIRFDSLNTHVEQIGRRSAEMLIERIGNPDLPTRQHLIPGIFAPGETVRRID